MATDQQDLRPLHILIPSDLKDRLKRMADARDRSVAAETRRAIEDRLNGFEGEPGPIPAGTGEVA
jgi:predicted transcriptional regulator